MIGLAEGLNGDHSRGYDGSWGSNAGGIDIQHEIELANTEALNARWPLKDVDDVQILDEYMTFKFDGKVIRLDFSNLVMFKEDLELANSEDDELYILWNCVRVYKNYTSSPDFHQVWEKLGGEKASSKDMLNI